MHETFFALPHGTEPHLCLDDLLKIIIGSARKKKILCKKIKLIWIATIKLIMQENIDKLDMQKEKKIMQEKEIEYAKKKKLH